MRSGTKLRPDNRKLAGKKTGGGTTERVQARKARLGVLE
jgi:hypothetical protein